MKKNDISTEHFSLYEDCDKFYKIGYGLTLTDENMYSWHELYFFKNEYPTINIDIIETAIIKDIDSQTDEDILNGFVWNDFCVRLKREDLFNFKAAYDLAYQTNGASLPIKFKLGNSPIEYKKADKPYLTPTKTGGEPIYYTFTTMEEFTDFYTKAIAHINQCLNIGWQRKDSIKRSEYETALKHTNN